MDQPSQPVDLQRLAERHLALTENAKILLQTVRGQSEIVQGEARVREALLAATKENTKNIRAIVGIIEGHEPRL